MDAQISALAKRVAEHSETIQTEEAAKTSAVLPFLQALGYDVFNPSEVVPEFTADTYSRRGEKVDYAVMRDGAVSILIECKGLSTQLNEKHLGQLYRYFSVTKARFAILTNGREFRFFSDLEEDNKLDKKPFFTFDLLDHSQAALEELQKFTRQDFDVANILEQAERLKYVSIVRKVVEKWIDAPPDGLVRLMVQEVYDGRMNKDVREAVAQAIPAAFRDLVRDKVRGRLSSVLEDGHDDRAASAEPTELDDGVDTTQEEIEGWLTVRSILRASIDADRIHMRDARSYCAILLDNNNRKPLARLHFNRKQKYVGLFDGDKEDRVPVQSLTDIFGFATRLEAAANKYA